MTVVPAHDQTEQDVAQVGSRPAVCILTETFCPEIGGGETQARSLAQALGKQGWHVLVLTRRSDANLPRHEVMGGVPVHRIGPSGPAHWKKWGLLLSSGPALWRLRGEYDLVFVSGFRVVGMTAVLLAKFLRKRVILKADSLGEMSGDFFSAGLARLRLGPSCVPFRAFLAVRNRILRRADGLVAISSEVATELLAAGVEESSVHRIPNSVDTTRFRPVADDEKQRLRAKLHIKQESTVVIFTGRLVSYKGLPLLLRVWREIVRRHEDIELLLVGPGGLDIHNCEAELRAFVGASGLEESVRFTGGVDNVEEYLRAADIFVFPTENEAFGISLIEAMACGLPVISTSVDGVKAIVQHKQNGLIVEPRNFQQLSEALDTLIADSALTVRLGAAAGQAVQGRYSSDVVTGEYAELFTGTELRETPNRWVHGAASHLGTAPAPESGVRDQAFRVSEVRSVKGRPRTADERASRHGSAKRRKSQP